MAEPSAPDPSAAPTDGRRPPKPSVVDHLRVLWLLIATFLGVIPFALHLLVAPITTPRARRRMRRLLERPAPSPDEFAAVDPAAWDGKTIFVVAGEPSGDRLAARVVEAIRREAPGVRIRGFGGAALAAAGATLDRDIVGHAVVGVFGVLGSLRYWWRLCVEALARFRDDPPDLLLTVDFPGLNVRLARWARGRGIRTVHLVAPQTWGWAPWRAGRLRRAVDRLLVTFPFEAAWFSDRGVTASFVGHPLFEAPLPPPRSPEAPPGAAPWIELRPGSRRRDVRRQTPILLDAARRVRERIPSAKFLVRLDSSGALEEFAAIESRRRPGGPENFDVRAGSGPGEPRVAAALTTSGTSTCELAVDQVPMVVFYRASFLGRLGAKALVTSPFIAMANLLAGKEIVPERLVGRRGGAALADDLVAILEDPARWSAMREALGVVRDRVSHSGVADRAARAILALT